ncbi:MAG: hypothetical protein GX868_09220 [Actinobacteria bacterium]|nr:hypothetical protein [Actinomycetota bacterium]
MAKRPAKRPNNECPCGSGASYTRCCKAFHLRQALPETAESLMRSRYVAFAKRLDSYLLFTWAPETRPATLTLSGAQTFTGLDIVATEAGGPGDAGGLVEFTARYVIDGRAAALHEVSLFRRLTEEDDRWVYVDGDVS